MNSSVGTALDKPAGKVVVKPMTVHIGAEIDGVDLTRPLADAEVAAIRQALLDWKVIFFRNQHLDHQQHVEFARRFGDPTPAHVVFGGGTEFPEIYPVTRNRTGGAGHSRNTRAWTDWHTDITAAINPPMASILRAVVVPPYGGDTHWCNLAAAYRALSPTMQVLISGLRCIHRYQRAEHDDNAADYNRLIDDNALVAEHPLVAIHPETGEQSLYTSPDFAQQIAGLEARESEALLEFLWEHSVRAEFCVRFKWEPGSIAFWDNRSTQHQAIRDVYDSDFEREFFRVTLNGEIPRGVDGLPSRALSGAPITAI